MCETIITVYKGPIHTFTKNPTQTLRYYQSSVTLVLSSVFFTVNPRALETDLFMESFMKSNGSDTCSVTAEY